MTATDVDVLVIGAGPAGALAAAILCREGFRALVIEKQKFPRFVIGESMLPCSMNLLKDAGLLEAVQQRGYMKKCGAIFLRGGETCNFDFSHQSAAMGWDHTFQVPRADFDQVLADAAAASGAEILYEHGVTAVSFTDESARVTIEQPDRTKRDVTAKFVLDCSGYGRVIPRLLGLDEPSDLPPRESLFTHVRGDVRMDGRDEGKIWICIHGGGAWLWIIPFSDGTTSIGAVGDAEFFAAYPSDPAARLRAIFAGEPNAARRLAGMEFLWEPKRIAGYSVGVKRLHGPRFALAGNATEFLDPVFSSGVALAFSSADRAARLIARELRGETVDWESDYAAFMKQGVDTFRAYVEAWYDGTFADILFSAGNNREIMKQVCSVLAGYVWDKSNPYAMQPKRALPLLHRIVTNFAAATARGAV